MHNAARIDELWDTTVSLQIDQPYLQTNRYLEAVIPTFTTQMQQKVPIEIDFLGQRIVWTQDGNRPFPDRVLQALEQLIEFHTLPVGWDSYGGHPLRTGAVASAVSLIFMGHRRGALPRLVPLSNGGIGLRWEADHRSLEIDVSPDGKAEAMLEDEHLGTLEETEVGTAIKNLAPILERYFQAA